MTLQRDVFIKTVHEAAREDKDIYFLSADFGAEALDSFRTELPDQFVHCGISEQHMIDMAAGLSLAGKKVFVYCMGPFMALRCYEQTKCSLAMMGRPVTMISAGVGLGYADSGPTHYVTEDIACLRALPGVQVFTPADNVAAEIMAKECVKDPQLRYIRLDREALPSIYDPVDFMEAWPIGYCEVIKGQGLCILSSGYMLHRAIDACGRISLHLMDDVGVIDLFRIKPIDADELQQALYNYRTVITLEEQVLSGGFGSAILEVVSDYGLKKKVLRMGMPDRFYFENGGRGAILDRFGLSVDDIYSVVQDS